MEQNCTLLEWLHSQPLPEDTMPLPWDLSVSYIPIEVVRAKFEIMRKQFGAIITQTDVTVNAIATYEKDTCFWATVSFTIKHKEFDGGMMMLCGTGSFLAGQYKGGWAFAQIAESLATTRAFSKEWEQFGKGLNTKEDEVKSLTAPSAKKNNFKMDNTLKSLGK